MWTERASAAWQQLYEPVFSVERRISLSEVHSAPVCTRFHDGSSTFHAASSAHVATESQKRLWSGA
eukprot:5998939-Prorocentrum_lima.AAC.1